MTVNDASLGESGSKLSKVAATSLLMGVTRASSEAYTQRETSFHFHSHLELYIIDEQPFAIPGMNIFAHLEVIDSVVGHSVAH